MYIELNMFIHFIVIQKESNLIKKLNITSDIRVEYYKKYY